MVSGVSSIQLAPHNFILGSENRLLEMAIGVLRSGGMDAPLLVVCGPPGSGKTHLARGLAEGSLGGPCYYLDAETLRRALADHRQPERLAAWRQQMYAAALVVFDGVDDLAGQASSQQELAALIDAIQDSGGRLMISSRSNPISSAPLSPRLISRLEAGLIVSIAPPQQAARRALLEAFAARQQLQLDRRAAVALVESQYGSSGEMLGAMSRVSAAGDEMTAADLKEMFGPGGSARPRMATIVATVAKRYRLSPDDLRGRSRRRTVATARAMAMYLCRRWTGSHLHQIGKYLGGRDHTTVLHGCQKMEQLLETDATVRADYAQLCRALAGPNRRGHRRGKRVKLMSPGTMP